MDEAPKARGGWVGWVVGAVFALMILYVLSVGPAMAVAKWAGGPHRAVRAFYAPLEWLHSHTPLRRPLDAYIDLWTR